MKASKADLRREINELRKTGNIMSNLCYNFSRPSWSLADHDRKTMHELQVKWDAIPKAEPKC